MEITKQELAELVATAIAAAKAPNAVEQSKLDAEARALKEAQAARLALSESVQDGIRQKRMTQRICSHEHKNGDSHMVYIQEAGGPGYLLCQKNQCKVRPGFAPDSYVGDDIYDTDLFNRCFQKIATTGEIFG